MFGFEKGVEALRAEFPAPAALLGASEWALARGGHAIIYPYRARLQRFHQPEGAREVTGERISAQPVGRGIGALDGLGLRIKWADRRHRGERFLTKTQR